MMFFQKSREIDAKSSAHNRPRALEDVIKILNTLGFENMSISLKTKIFIEKNYPKKHEKK